MENPSRDVLLQHVEKLMADYYWRNKTSWPQRLQEGEMLSGKAFSSVARTAQELQAHGMAKVDPVRAVRDLVALFERGIDTDETNGRRGFLDSAPLVRGSGAGHHGTTATGEAYRDGCFILVAAKDVRKMDDVSKIAGVLVNQDVVETVPDILIYLPLLLPPTVMVRSYSDVRDVVRHARCLPLKKATVKTASMRWGKEDANAPTDKQERMPVRPDPKKLPDLPDEIVL